MQVIINVTIFCSTVLQIMFLNCRMQYSYRGAITTVSSVSLPLSLLSVLLHDVQIFGPSSALLNYFQIYSIKDRWNTKIFLQYIHLLFMLFKKRNAPENILWAQLDNCNLDLSIMTRMWSTRQSHTATGWHGKLYTCISNTLWEVLIPNFLYKTTEIRKAGVVVSPKAFASKYSEFSKKKPVF